MLGNMVDNNDRKRIQETFTFWQHLKEEERQLILNNYKAASYKQGENIHGGNKDCTGILILKSGSLRCYILSEEGREVTLYRIRAGELCILSASCVLKNISFEVHIDAEENSEIILINALIINRLSQNVYAENYFLKEAMTRFSDVMWSMEQILFLKFDQRLAIFLLDESLSTGRDSITITHEQIAKHLGSAREVVTRMLKYFLQEGLVGLSRGEVRLIDKEKLRRLAL